MPYKFGKNSLLVYNTLHPYLQLICNELIKIYDVRLIDGHRNEKKQNNYFHGGKSTVQFPQSKHNKKPSHAVDLAPYPIDWENTKRFYFMIGLIKGISSQLHIPIRSGADWDRDNDFDDNYFKDLNHIEIDL